MFFLTLCFVFFFKDPAPPEFSPFPLPAPFPIPDDGRRDREPAPDARAARHQQDVLAGQRRPRVEPDRLLEPRERLLARSLAQLGDGQVRSEEHTSELQSRLHLVCRLLLEKKKRK